MRAAAVLPPKGPRPLDHSTGRCAGAAGAGKFDTNALVCRFAALAMNTLRLMVQRGLLGPDAPVRHEAERRRTKTVIQGLIYGAGRLIEHGRQMVLGLGANNGAAAVFMRLHAQFAATA